MKVIDLADEHKGIYFVCLEDWSAEIAEAGDHKRIWYEPGLHAGVLVQETWVQESGQDRPAGSPLEAFCR